MSVVIRCPACNNLSRTGSESLGQLVICPSCRGPFVATEAARNRTARAIPVSAPPPSQPENNDSHSHDALASSPALPKSVLFGLSLLPFLIPLVWMLAPLLFGWEPMLSLVVPITLAIAASTLSLAVVSTIDWTPLTRIKGVFMIVGLAYFTGALLFFLKPEAAEWVKKNFGNDMAWHQFWPRGAGCGVKMPGNEIEKVNDQPLPGWDLDQCYRAKVEDANGPITYTLGIGKVGRKIDPEDWFKRAKMALETDVGVPAQDERRVMSRQRRLGREWTLPLPNDGPVRVVQVYRSGERFFYLAVEGVNIKSSEDNVSEFFSSFRVMNDFR